MLALRELTHRCLSPQTGSLPNRRLVGNPCRHLNVRILSAPGLHRTRRSSRNQMRNRLMLRRPQQELQLLPVLLPAHTRRREIPDRTKYLPCGSHRLEKIPTGTKAPNSARTEGMQPLQPLLRQLSSVVRHALLQPTSLLFFFSSALTWYSRIAIFSANTRALSSSLVSSVEA